MRLHSDKGPSSAYRWIQCPGSVRLSASLIEEDLPSSAAQEGTDGHKLCEYLLNRAMGREVEDPRDTLEYYTPEMQKHCEGYRDYVMELYHACKSPTLLVEQRIEYERFVSDGFGTADCLLIDDGTLTVVDFKYGVGIGVSAVGNSQMRIYAIGALEMLDSLYDIDTVRMIIYQPRRANISEDQMTRDELYDWAENVLKPAALEADSETGEFHSGEWCRFCKAKRICRERAKENLELAALDFPSPPLLTDEEIVEILGKVDNLVAWANDIMEYALQEAKAGKQWPGWQLVQGRKNRKYKDEKAVEKAVRDAGFDPFETVLRSVTDMEKMMGKKKFEAVLGDLIIRPSGNLKLEQIED